MDKKHRAVPTGRFTRFGMLGSLATRVAGNMLTSGAGQLLKGEKPVLKDLLLTPGNVGRIADQLANMRGAAMKVGQLMSMDAGDILPPPLAEILSRLRSDADPMPKQQVNDVLSKALGADWADQFLYFSYAPIAAASIGQVHKVILPTGEMLALKIQYPGVKQSIDSDVDNVATLLSITGLLPKGVDFKPLLDEAKRQLHTEADYIAEADMLERYKALVAEDKRFAVPDVYREFTRDNVLAMTFMPSEPIESQLDADQTTRDNIASALFELFFTETFEHHLIQTDPNFANYRYDPQDDKVVLLDFGATREYSRDFIHLYRELMSGVVHSDPERVRTAVLNIGLMSKDLAPELQDFIVSMCFDACEPLVTAGEYDFGTSDLGKRLQEKGMSLSNNEAFWHVPPANSVFLHRKLGGIFLLASNLKARVDVHSIASRHVND
ncbi:AarF/ABC1/UbiB kinase family protein [Alteromonas sp. ASW11-36]|uniref:AarF/ABC1/UbiB kinase family protein n=1 Tax=Alteromonas arenosi TaxID=3055817 RepID=A0ABT7T0N3_9ALTE|nr:AarF/ABC1/UbiB kinase family protein [Alteromonas sp. ASW11-36]MDM7862000.1 AarF/ABC1/UbiB kinase family protein [Alteromonas sp. ASW11-36]